MRCGRKRRDRAQCLSRPRLSNVFSNAQRKHSHCRCRFVIALALSSPALALKTAGGRSRWMGGQLRVFLTRLVAGKGAGGRYVTVMSRSPFVVQVSQRRPGRNRDQKRQGRAAIPDELWSAAVEVARRDGVTRTATALHLDGGKLKRLMMAADGVAKGERRRHRSWN